MSAARAEGNLRKLVTALPADGIAQYELPCGDALIPLNPLLGERVRLVYDGAINCIHCGRKTKKSFNQGYCYPCFKRLAQCDSCIVKPEKCHYHAGTCREPEWGEVHCMTDHIVYLANTSGLKVGITRATQVPTRWIDQGATEALPVFRVPTRLASGLVEVIFAGHVADKTAWQANLKGPGMEFDLAAERDRLTEICQPALRRLQDERGLDAVTALDEERATRIDYPVIEYPQKVKSMTLDKLPEVSGVLRGIKGQYLIFDTGVINMRKYGGYRLQLTQHREV